MMCEAGRQAGVGRHSNRHSTTGSHQEAQQAKHQHALICTAKFLALTFCEYR